MPRRRTPRGPRSPTALLRSLLPRTPRLRSVPLRPRVPPRRPTPGRWLSCRADDGRSYEVYLPAGLRRRVRAPVVLLLHGCTQSPAQFADATRFTTVADRNRLLLVLPRQESRHHPQRCWRWYEAAHQRRGAGEPAALVAIVGRVLDEESRWRGDPRRVYVAGLSAGGAMALTLAATYPDVFAAAGVHSAPAYRSAVRGSQAQAAMAGRTPLPRPAAGAPPMAPLMVVQGADDRLVHPVNGDRVADQWLAHRDPAGMGRARSDTLRTADGRGYARVRWYSARGRLVLQYWRIEGLGHAWSGGRPGGSYSDPAGPRAATAMWGFFRAHRLETLGRARPAGLLG